MQTYQELKSGGLNITARSENGAFKVTSYIGKRRKSRVYGYFDHKTQKYIEKVIQ